MDAQQTLPDDSSLIELVGRLDVSTVPVVRERLQRAVDAGEGELVIDLAGLEIVDATGLGALAGTSRRATAAGRTVSLRAVPPRIARLLRGARLDRLLRMEREAR